VLLIAGVSVTIPRLQICVGSRGGSKMAIGVLVGLRGFAQEQYDLIARKLTGGV